MAAPAPSYAPQGNGLHEPKYEQRPPQYEANKAASNSPPIVNGNKQSFDEAFKVERPRWHDLWAGLLVWPRQSLLFEAAS